MSEVSVVANPEPKTSWRPSVSTGPDANAVKVGVIGYGYWGPNIVRNLSALEGWHVAAVCVWGAFTLFQLVLWWLNSMLLVREAMNVNEGELGAIGLGFAIVWVLHAGFWLGLVPFLLYVIGNALRLF